MGLVTDREEWRGLLDAAAGAGIGRDSVTVNVRRIVDEDLPSRFMSAGVVDIDIRDPATWAMNLEARTALEGKLRAAVDPRWDVPGLRFHFRRPVPIEAASKSLDTIDALWRDWHRDRVDDAAFETARCKISELRKRIWQDGEDWAPLAVRYDEILAEARRHPKPPKSLPPLPEGSVAVQEVMGVLRAIAAGEVIPRIIAPAKWSDLAHSVGSFEAQGWMIDAFKRSDGMKYVQAVVAPDGRTGDFDHFHNREGDPFCLLDDDEQDRVCDVLDAQ